MKARRFVIPLFLSLLLGACRSRPLPAVSATATASPSPQLPALRSPPPSACASTYGKLFAKDQLDFRVVFGYKDARPARYVGDRYERDFFVQKLLFSGFRRASADDVFLYSLIGLDGRPKEIRLTVVESSAGPDDDENRRDPFQKWKSARAEEVFLSGLRDADLVFYYGHSRDGGGPDFSPPELTKNLHVNYGWYLRNQAGLKKMSAALAGGPGATPRATFKVVGLFSCVSDRLFSKELQTARSGVSLLTSKVLLYYSDALDGMLETLKDILEFRCRPDFHPAGTQILDFFQGTD